MTKLQRLLVKSLKNELREREAERAKAAKKLPPRECYQCHKRFVPANPYLVWCCDECRDKAWGKGKYYEGTNGARGYRHHIIWGA